MMGRGGLSPKPSYVPTSHSSSPQTACSISSEEGLSRFGMNSSVNSKKPILMAHGSLTPRGGDGGVGAGAGEG